jgi:gas vesicle protein
MPILVSFPCIYWLKVGRYIYIWRPALGFRGVNSSKVVYKASVESRPCIRGNQMKNYVFAAVAALALAACSGEGEEPTEIEEAAAEVAAETEEMAAEAGAAIEAGAEDAAEATGEMLEATGDMIDEGLDAVEGAVEDMTDEAEEVEADVEAEVEAHTEH